MKPVFKEIVFISKAIACIKAKVIEWHLIWIILEANSSFVGSPVVFTINVELVKVIITPAQGNQDNIVESGQLRISSDS
jgi:hypothetical protein